MYSERKRSAAINGAMEQTPSAEEDHEMRLKSLNLKLFFFRLCEKSYI